jgi:hypothetical protein
VTKPLNKKDWVWWITLTVLAVFSLYLLSKYWPTAEAEPNEPEIIAWLDPNSVNIEENGFDLTKYEESDFLIITHPPEPNFSLWLDEELKLYFTDPNGNYMEVPKILSRLESIEKRLEAIEEMSIKGYWVEDIYCKRFIVEEGESK